MAKNKNYMVCKFETKEDFERHFNSIYNSGYESGFDDGMAHVLSLMLDMIDKFSPEIQQKAEWIARQCHIKIFQKNIKEKEE